MTKLNPSPRRLFVVFASFVVIMHFAPRLTVAIRRRSHPSPDGGRIPLTVTIRRQTVDAHPYPSPSVATRSHPSPDGGRIPLSVAIRRQTVDSSYSPTSSNNSWLPINARLHLQSPDLGVIRSMIFQPNVSGYEVGSPSHDLAFPLRTKLFVFFESFVVIMHFASCFLSIALGQGFSGSDRWSFVA